MGPATHRGGVDISLQRSRTLNPQMEWAKRWTEIITKNLYEKTSSKHACINTFNLFKVVGFLFVKGVIDKDKFLFLISEIFVMTLTRLRTLGAAGHLMDTSQLNPSQKLSFILLSEHYIYGAEISLGTKFWCFRPEKCNGFSSLILNFIKFFRF